MTWNWHLSALDEPALVRLAELVALKARAGDTIALRGDLGAGKTTFARAFIRALLSDPDAEVASPTFPIVIPYETSRLPVSHFDLYRLSNAGDADEIGLDEASRHGVALVEWPERIGDRLAGERLDIRIDSAVSPERRDVTLSSEGHWEPRMRRLAEIATFLETTCASGGPAALRYLQGDASPRAYARLVCKGMPHILMDSPRMADGPPIRDGQPYSRIAHIAEDVRAFHAMSDALAARGIAVPIVRAFDHEAGLLLVDDLGERTFAAALLTGTPQRDLWAAALDCLVTLSGTAPPTALPLAGSTAAHTLPDYDRGALGIEVELLADWYWPLVKGSPMPAPLEAEFLALWQPIIDALVRRPAGWVLRDFHSPNLMWRPDEQGLERVGVLDFQDAMRGPVAYDVVSLLMDARIDVPEGLERDLFEYYVTARSATAPAFDREAFARDYAALGAQRNTKILGIFARLAERDGKRQYLAHMPRIWGYLDRAIRHPALGDLSRWMRHHFPAEARRPIV